MKLKEYIANLIWNLIFRFNPGKKSHIIFNLILILLILGSSILTDTLLELLLQADGVTRLSSLKEMI